MEKLVGISISLRSFIVSGCSLKFISESPSDGSAIKKSKKYPELRAEDFFSLQ